MKIETLEAFLGFTQKSLQTIDDQLQEIGLVVLTECDVDNKDHAILTERIADARVALRKAINALRKPIE